MIAQPDRPATANGLFLWVMHRFAEVFEDHAIMKGGMALRLIDSPRSTTDIDYVFVPYSSKRGIREQIEKVLHELDDATIFTELHSKMLRAEIQLDHAAIQLEVNVALDCSGTPISTGSFARELGQPPRVVRIMSSNWALAHKLAAWNERRLLRDLYDCYFFVARLDERPEPAVLDQRLANVNSRLPALASRKTMTCAELALDLREETRSFTAEKLTAELGGLLPDTELAGLVPRLKNAMLKLAEWLEDH